MPAPVRFRRIAIARQVDMSRQVLLVDIGNSRLKWAFWRAGELHPGMPFPSASQGLSGRLTQSWAALTPPAAVYAANVAGPCVEASLQAWVERHWGLPVRFARTEAEGGGVINGYRHPERLGVDRWLALVGLRRHYPLPACVLDCGTAITLDYLDAEGRHQGGLIAPGLQSMRSVLASKTHQLGGIDDVTTVNPCLARDTHEGIQAGCLHACAGLIEKVVKELRQREDDELHLVMTGGDAAIIGQVLAYPHHQDEQLVLRGLSSLVG